MKKIYSLLSLIVLMMFAGGCASTEQVNRLEGQVAELNGRLDQLAEESQANRSLIEDLSAKLSSSGINNTSGDKSTTEKTDVKKKPAGIKQCKATTKKGTQCTRNAQEGSDYCWQHQGNSGGGNSTSISSGSREIFTGPRGGQYYINSKGKKTYIRKKK